MKILLNANVYGWVMTGIIGKDAKWFLGFSRVPGAAEKLSQVRELVDSNLWIAAIKKHRELFGSTLREAKDIVDEMRNAK